MMVQPLYLRIAKSAILQKLLKDYSFKKEVLLEQDDALSLEGATFVTLESNHSLRGCIGSIIAHRKLLDDLIHNAQAAAFSDPRFAPLTQEELSSLTLEVSILSKPQELEYEDFEDLLSKITPHKDGLILKHNHYQGTFLPQVWEQLSHPKDFLEHLSYKAGSSPAIYAQHPSIFSYRVEARKESFDAILPL